MASSAWGTRRSWEVPRLLIAAVAVPLVVAACGGSSIHVNDLKNADAPYYYVGESFHGLKVTHVLRYQRGDAALIYGDCKARSDMGCAPPLELEHRLCHGTVTVVIWANGDRLAARAAHALRPLSRGARSAQPPKIAFGHSPYCSP